MRHFSALTLTLALVAGCAVVAPARAPRAAATGMATTVKAADDGKVDGATPASAAAGTGALVAGGTTASETLPIQLPTKILVDLPGLLGQAQGVIGQDGSSLLGQDGTSLIGQDGTSLIGQDGNSLTGEKGAGYRLAEAEVDAVGSDSASPSPTESPSPDGGRRQMGAVLKTDAGILLRMVGGAQFILSRLAERTYRDGEVFTEEVGGDVPLSLVGKVERAGGEIHVTVWNANGATQPEPLLVLAFESMTHGRVLFRMSIPLLGLDPLPSMDLALNFNLDAGEVTAETFRTGGLDREDDVRGRRGHFEARSRQADASQPVHLVFRDTFVTSPRSAPKNLLKRACTAQFDQSGAASMIFAENSLGDGAPLSWLVDNRLFLSQNAADPHVLYVDQQFTDVSPSDAPASLTALAPRDEQLITAFPALPEAVAIGEDPAFKYPDWVVLAPPPEPWPTPRPRSTRSAGHMPDIDP